MLTDGLDRVKHSLHALFEGFGEKVDCVFLLISVWFRQNRLGKRYDSPALRPAVPTMIGNSSDP